MDILVGVIVWGGLALLVLAWFGRAGTDPGQRGRTDQPTPRAAPPTANRPPGPPVTAPQRAAEDQRQRESDALVDGLIIGHFLTRDHFTGRIDGLNEQIDELADDRDRWLDAASSGDDLDGDLDYAEFDAMGGFGVEPWADDLFDHDDED